MRTRSPAALRAFVRRHTRLRAVPDAPGVRLHLADDVTALWRSVGRELADPDPPLPYWAFAWPGGLAIVRYLRDQPDLVEGRRVLDLASGSGLCAIAAHRCGAASVLAIDVDPLAEAAVRVNASANGVRVGVSRRDPLLDDPPEFDIILAGDVCYQETMARRMVDWLVAAAASGATVLLGDPGRAYLPAGLERLATYEVRTSHEIEDAEVKVASVFTLA